MASEVGSGPRRGIWKGRLGDILELGRQWDSAAGLASREEKGRDT